ncbi:hypothetical protein [Roseivivax marinus]|uniref:hypothetical protein n=1 Tax=Roseivivax marinus TaxID=1379903 RepID=UPI00273D1DBE|nr:hypothetical protein [Roseivivax marinus]
MTFQGEANAWSIEDGLLCVASTTPDPRAQSDSNYQSACPEALFSSAIEIQNHTIEWRKDTTISFSREQSGDLRVIAEDSNTAELPVGSVIIIPAEAWASHGALVFRGVSSIGKDMGPGASDYLIEGTWEARQLGAATSFFRDTTEVVKRGTLIRGAHAQILDSEGNPVETFGHLTPLKSDEPGLGMVVLSEKGDQILSVGYYGLQDQSRFEPDWLDTVTSSPALIALAVFFGLLLTTLQLMLLIAPFTERREIGRTDIN